MSSSHSLVLESINRYARQSPSLKAISTSTRKDANITITYRELEGDIYNLSEKLKPYEGNPIAIEIANSYEWIVADLACIAAKVTTIPIPPFFNDKQRRNALINSGAKAIMDCSLTVHRLEYDTVELPINTAKITYSSGTTCNPKGVCLSQESMEKIAQSLLERIGISAAKHTAALLPLPVLLENVAGCYTTLLAGGCYDIQPQDKIGLGKNVKPDFIKLVKYLEQSKASSCIMVPELLKGTIQAISQTKTKLPYMKFIAVGGAKLSPSLLNKAEQLGLPVYQGYGLSECASVVAVNTPSDNRVGSVGKILPHLDIRISDIDGEIIVTNPAALGYMDNGSTIEIAREYATGDIGKIDDEGFLYITGRKKNIIITSYGRNISPEWPESELLSQPEIAQAIVLGDAAPQLIALIVTANNDVNNNILKEAIARANAKLPEYVQVKKWLKVPPFSVDEGLLTGTLRPRRDAIIEKYRTAINKLLT